MSKNNHKRIPAVDKRSFRIPALLLLCSFYGACLVEPASSEGDEFLLGLAAGAANTTTAADTSDAGTTSTSSVDSITDNGDGTITAVLNGITRMYPKCHQDNTASGNRYGGGGTADTCTTGSSGTMAYCSAADNSCNGGTNAGQLDGGGTSAIHTSCAGLSLGGHTDWRVPTAAELFNFFRDVALVQPSLFPNTFTFAFTHWSSSSLSATNATQLDFSTGNFASVSKTTTHRVHCIRVP